MSFRIDAAPDAFTAATRIPSLLTAPGLAAAVTAMTAAIAALVVALGPSMAAMAAEAPAAAAAAAALATLGVARAAGALAQFRREALSVAQAQLTLWRAASRRADGRLPGLADPDALDEALAEDLSGDFDDPADDPIRAVRRPSRLGPTHDDLATLGGPGLGPSRRRLQTRAASANRFWTRLIGATIAAGLFAFAFGAYQALTDFGQAGSTALSQIADAAEPLTVTLAGQPTELLLSASDVGALASAASALSLADGLGGLILCALAAVFLLSLAAAETAAARALTVEIGALGRRDYATALRLRAEPAPAPAQTPRPGAPAAPQETAPPADLSRLTETQAALLASHKALLDRLEGISAAAPTARAPGDEADGESRASAERRTQALDYVGRERRSTDQRPVDGGEAQADTQWMIEMSTADVETRTTADAASDGTAGAAQEPTDLPEADPRRASGI